MAHHVDILAKAKKRHNMPLMLGSHGSPHGTPRRYVAYRGLPKGTGEVPGVPTEARGIPGSSQENQRDHLAGARGQFPWGSEIPLVLMQPADVPREPIKINYHGNRSSGRKRYKCHG